jgi:hypothetical protein
MHCLHQVVVTLVLIAVNGVTAVFVDEFDVCKDNIKKIINGTLTMGDINNVTIWEPERGLLFTGTPKELDNHYPRELYITPTYKGKQAI